MSLPHYEPFYLDTLDELRSEIGRLGVDVPVSEDISVLAEAVPGTSIVNRFCAQPIMGLDAQADGSPGPLTRHRYRRLAAGGFGVVWVESTCVGASGPQGRLRIADDNVDAFADFVRELHDVASRPMKLILQVSMPPVGGDPGDLADVMRLAKRAGFDGVDVQGAGNMACNETDKHGLMVASRVVAYNATGPPDGVGTDESDYRQEDLREVKQLVKRLRCNGVSLLNVTCASPRLRGPAAGRKQRPVPDHGVPDEHPLQVLGRQLRIAGSLRSVVPGLPVVGSGFSWLRHLLPHVAAGAVQRGMIDLVGLGRSALACPDAPRRIMAGDGLDLADTCMVCFACNELLARGGPVGCPVRDPEKYGVERAACREEPGDLLAEAGRCHRCEAAPCVAASRTGTDLPAMMEAWRRGDERRAYEILRRSDVLPEMTAELTPGWLHSEGACIETALTGRPVPIQDLQHTVAWQARERGETGVRLPEAASGRVVAVVGGGPAGIAATVRLLEHGHTVDLHECSEALGGTPGRIIPASRFRSPEAEINALLAPGLESGRLRLHLGNALGVDLDLDTLGARSGAVLLAMGVWQERGLVGMSDGEGVMDGLGFLESAKRGKLSSVPERVAILAGGDCAMDAARVAEELGAKEIFIVYGGARSEMHWHMSDDWFGKSGHHAMMACLPLGYATAGGMLRGLRIREGGEERVLDVGLVIEAMGLEVSDDMRSALPGIDFNAHGLVALTDGSRTTRSGVHAAGGLVNGGASVARCVAEGLAAAEDIHAALKGAG